MLAHAGAYLLSIYIFYTHFLFIIIGNVGKLGGYIVYYKLWSIIYQLINFNTTLLRELCMFNTVLLRELCMIYYLPRGLGAAYCFLMLILIHFII